MHAGLGGETHIIGGTVYLWCSIAEREIQMRAMRNGNVCERRQRTTRETTEHPHTRHKSCQEMIFFKEIIADVS